MESKAKGEHDEAGFTRKVPAWKVKGATGQRKKERCVYPHRLWRADQGRQWGLFSGLRAGHPLALRRKVYATIILQTSHKFLRSKLTNTHSLRSFSVTYPHLSSTKIFFLN